MSLQTVLRQQKDPAAAAAGYRFLQCQEGGYGDTNDKFLGLSVPTVRKAAKEFKNLSLTEIDKVLTSKFHEERLCALIILAQRMPKADESEQKKIVALFLKRKAYVNNWDLVDSSAPYILGFYLSRRPVKERAILYTLAKSKHLWDRRIAMVATWGLIRAGDLSDVFQLAEALRDDKHDLMHKAVGWMLREAGKRDVKKLEAFLDRHATRMPRTALRYSLEKFSKAKRLHYMRKP